MKEKTINVDKPRFINTTSLQEIITPIWQEFKELEITGGGEPTLHPEINDIISLFKGKYRKIYTNGFLLKHLPEFEEVNISRIHWDSNINKIFYRSIFQNDLNDVIDHYKLIAQKIRIQTILIKGALDTKEKIMEFIEKYEDKVDTFMFRTLFPKCKLEKDKFVPYPEGLKHPKIKLDATLDSYKRPLLFVNTDCMIHKTFKY
jgi:wyosine [tRNA(Phe)-imidazoG37] synthetase (radical SAM superfamily)